MRARPRASPATATARVARPRVRTGAHRASTPSRRPIAPNRALYDADESAAFERFTRDASIRSRVRLGRGENGRGLFTTAPAGWKAVELLLEVPLDVCIVCPVGEARGSASTDATARAVVASWERRNASVPEAIKDLMFEKDSDSRELACALWVLFATRAGGKVWESYAGWLPKTRGVDGLPSMLLATEEELEMMQSEGLLARARELRSLVRAAFDRVPFAHGIPGKLTLEDLSWAFALVTSRAIACEVGRDPDGGTDDTQVAVMAPGVDMANHVDVTNVTALKKIGASDGGGLRGAYWRLATGGSVDGGGGACCLETNRPIKGADEEVTISYQPEASNEDLMTSYGFSLRGNRNDRLRVPQMNRLRLGAFRQAIEDTGLLTSDTPEEDVRRFIAVVASACGLSIGKELTQDDWELDADAAQREVDNAVALGQLWEAELTSYATSLEEDEEELARGIKYPTAFGRAAVEYRAERKRLLQTGLSALNAYVDWFYSEEAEEESDSTGAMPVGME